MNSIGHIARGILLVAGTSIGGGMLALPVLTSQAGFIPSLLIYFACWLFMACTGLLFLEISQWMEENANIVSMAGKTLGTPGKVAAWGLYLFLFYCLTLAYIVGAGDLIADLLRNFFALNSWQSQLLFLLIFGPCIYAGAALIGRVNFFLMIALGISFLIFVFLGYRYVNSSQLIEANWSKIGIALPITFTAFAYQGIIPTLVTYMHRNVRQIRLAILIGSFLPFITYIIWQWLILGIVPLAGPNSLEEALQNGQNAVSPLKNILHVPGVYFVGQCFACFALLTSFFGVTLGLLDFLADGMNVRKTPQNKIWLCLLILVPPFVFALLRPRVFLAALDYAGGIGCALLLGLMPVLMVWSGRYFLKMRGSYHVIGGKPLLVALIAFVVLELFCEFYW